MSITYQDLFTWAAPLYEGDGQSFFMEHHDGTISCAVSWDGIQPETAENKAQLDARWARIYQLFDELSRNQGVIFENHFERTHDNTLAKQYLEYGEQNMVRSEELGRLFRKELAGHLSMYARNNRVYCVVTLPSTLSGLSFLWSKKVRASIQDRKIKLKKVIDTLTAFLPGSCLLAVDDYAAEIIRHTDRDRIVVGSSKPINPRFHVNQQLIRKPLWEDGLIKCGDTYTKVILLIDYPDCDVNWFTYLANMQSVDLHVTQIIKPLNMSAETLRSARQSEKSSETAASYGGEETVGKVEDHNSFRHYIHKYDLTVHGNTYIIKLHGTDKQNLIDTAKIVEDNLVVQGAVFESQKEEIARLYWRVSLPGQGYKTPYFRPDHSWQVAHMAPVIKFDVGEKKALEMLRLTSESTLLGDNYVRNGVHHRITAAKTGSGKTVLEAAEICELFPLGYNFYITEVGRGFEWIVDMFGGDYFVLDAENTVVSPFPAYDLEYITEDEADDSLAFPTSLIGPTIESILPILLGTSDYEKIEGLEHYKSAAEDILQAMYIPEYHKKDSNSPTLETFLDVGRDILDLFEDSEPKTDSAKVMFDNLESFLSRAEGKIFTKSDTIDFSKPIIGVDFAQLLENENNDLAKYMLSFVLMRFKQVAFSVRNPTFIKADEWHEFTHIDKLLTDKLERQVTRRGRKKATYFGPISQEVEDMNEAGFNQYTHKSLMYYGSDHKDAPSKLKLSDRATEIWKSYRDPIEADYNHRQCLRVKGDKFFDLHLTWPKIITDLTNSNPDAIDLKMKINKITNDPFERLKLYSEADL